MMPAGMSNWDLLGAAWGERWAWTLLHSLWQDGLLAIGLWIVTFGAAFTTLRRTWAALSFLRNSKL